MAKPKGTGTPSYERICLGLASTSEFQEYERSFIQLVMSARVDGISFEKLAGSSREDGLPDHRYEVACGRNRVPGFRFREPGDLKMNVDALVTPDSLAPVLAVFGTKVRTYFCKEDAVREHFVKYARSLLCDRHVKTVQEAEARIAQQAKNLAESGRLEEGRMVAFENEAVDEIRDVLLKFRNIRREALKRALDEFIVHDVTNT